MGSSGGDSGLSAIASKGGTSLGQWISAEDQSALAEAFDTIILDIKECL